MGGLLGRAHGINTCGQREGSRMGQGEKLAVLELRWTFRCVVTRGPERYIRVLLSLYLKIAPKTIGLGV